MLKGKGEDILQALILTFFFVSVVLIFLNLVLASRRNAAFSQVERAVEEYDWLRRNLKQEKLRTALAMQKEIKTQRSRTDIYSEVNLRIKREALGVKPSNRFPPRRDRSGNYQIYVYNLDSGRGRDRVLHPLNVWIGFLGRVERDRPDIHVEQVTLETDQNEIPEGANKRDWACTAKLTLWEPVARR